MPYKPARGDRFVDGGVMAGVKMLLGVTKFIPDLFRTAVIKRCVHEALQIIRHYQYCR